MNIDIFTSFLVIIGWRYYDDIAWRDWAKEIKKIGLWIKCYMITK